LLARLIIISSDWKKTEWMSDNYGRRKEREREREREKEKKKERKIKKLMMKLRICHYFVAS
jgi:hypothetical protein